MTARRCFLELQYENKNITKDLLPHLKSWSYTDNISNQPDDLQINLEDRDGIWLEDWFPEKGAKLTAKIQRKNWNEREAEEKLPIGQFEIDEIGAGSSSEISIKALSIPQKNSLSGERKTKAWEKTKYSIIFKDIANRSKMGLFFDAKYNPDQDRVEQTEETDLEFMKKACSEMGWALKITDNKIVAFDEFKYEEEEPVRIIDRFIHPIKNWTATSKLREIYSSVKVIYKDPDKKQKVEHKYKPFTEKKEKKKQTKLKSKNKKKSKKEQEKTYTYMIPGAPNTDRILVIREQVNSLQEAEYKGKKALREKNKEAWTMSITVTCDLQLSASNTVLMKSFGKFSGKYIITQMVINQGSGTETRLQLRRCLEEY